MPVRGLWALAIAVGGIALGTMLGAAAKPEMKGPPERPWQGVLQSPVSASPAYLQIEAPPEDLAPSRDSYAPTWAGEELADWEPVYPAWTYGDHAGEPAAEPETRPTEEPSAPPAGSRPVESPPLASEPRIAGNLGALY